MRFEHIIWIHGLWFALAVGCFLWWSFKRKKRIMQNFVESKLIPELAGSWDVKREIIKMILFVSVFVFSFLALARPQWGFEWREIKRQGLDLIIAIDASRSMLTEDVKPNRLERAKLAVKDLIVKLKGDRLGLVAFAGAAVTVCPLTADYSGFLLALEDLSPQTVSRGGTSISLAIEEAIRGFDDALSDHQAIILISDGEHLEGPLESAIQVAKKKGIRIFTIGIGTPDGDLIRIRTERGEDDFLKDQQGRFVKSRLDEQTLKQIALRTDGAYVRSTGAEFGLDYLYQTRLSQMEKRDIDERMKKQHIDRFQIPLAIAATFLLLASGLSRRKKR